VKQEKEVMNWHLEEDEDIRIKKDPISVQIHRNSVSYEERMKEIE
jgi:hypothetical protein